MQVGGFKTATSQRKQKRHMFIQIKVYYLKKKRKKYGEYLNMTWGQQRKMKVY